MHPTLIWIIVFVVSLFVLIKASDYFTHSAEKIGLFFGIPAFIVGATIVAVALGTSLPELMVTIAAAKKGKPEMAVGNILGSNIFNAFAVMGIPALIGTLIIPHNILTFGLPMMLIATLLYFS